MKSSIPTAATACFVVWSNVISAAEPTQHQADACYFESMKAEQVADPSQLSVRNCNWAIHSRDLSRENRSKAFHNRGVIELAQGDADAARYSFERAVGMSSKVDLRNLALAQLAHKQGDLVVAIEQYSLVIESAKNSEALRPALAKVTRNRDRAVATLRSMEMEIAKH